MVPQAETGSEIDSAEVVPQMVWTQDARFTRAREHDLLGDQRALGNSKQLHNQMSYRFVNRLK